MEATGWQLSPKEMAEVDKIMPPPALDCRASVSGAISQTRRFAETPYKLIKGMSKVNKCYRRQHEFTR